MWRVGKNFGEVISLSLVLEYYSAEERITLTYSNIKLEFSEDTKGRPVPTIFCCNGLKEYA
jgi:hypothetical protein